jgi:cytochrome c551/c552
MKRAVPFLLVWSACAANMDSTRGAVLFQTQGCVQCHSVNGQGGHAAPDLGLAIDRSYTPAALASTMWNHAPAMWSAMQKVGSAPPPLDDQSAGDLFAFFYAARFFDHPADAARGKRVFVEKGCMGCHGAGNRALPPDQWKSVNDSVDLASATWNHAPQMQTENALVRKHWPQLTGQDLNDLLIYVRNSPGRSSSAGRFQIAGASGGESVFQSKGCAACHGSKNLPLADRLHSMTLTGIAAQMWNHAPLMKAPPTLISS